MTWALDLDGVVWQGDQAIAGSVRAVARLQDAGMNVVFVTNSSWKRSEAYVEKLASMGIETSARYLVHGGIGVGELISAGERVLVCGGDGVIEGLEQAGATVLSPGWAGASDVNAVVVGWRPDFDYELLTAATRAVLGGARLIGTNQDPLYPREDGLSPGTGALVAAVAAATGVSPVFGGKPLPVMAQLVKRRFPQIEVMVGDSPVSDGGLAQELGCRFVLVESGVAARHGLSDGHERAADLAGAVDAWFDADGSDEPA